MTTNSEKYRREADVLAFIEGAAQRTMNAKQLASRLSISRTTLWRLRRLDNDFPRGVRPLGGRTVRFSLTEVEAYERARGLKHVVQAIAPGIDEEASK